MSPPTAPDDGTPRRPRRAPVAERSSHRRARNSAPRPRRIEPWHNRSIVFGSFMEALADSQNQDSLQAQVRRAEEAQQSEPVHDTQPPPTEILPNVNGSSNERIHIEAPTNMPDIQAADASHNILSCHVSIDLPSPMPPMLPSSYGDAWPDEPATGPSTLHNSAASSLSEQTAHSSHRPSETVNFLNLGGQEQSSLQNDPTSLLLGGSRMEGDHYIASNLEDCVPTLQNSQQMRLRQSDDTHQPLPEYFPDFASLLKGLRADPPRNEHGEMTCSHDNCRTTPPIFSRLCEYNKHMDKHERPYKCNHWLCRDLPGFTYAGGLLRHRREVHGLRRARNSFYCPHSDCNRSNGEGFTRRENVEEHIRRRHGGVGLALVRKSPALDSSRSVNFYDKDKHQNVNRAPRIFSKPGSGQLIARIQTIVMNITATLQRRTNQIFLQARAEIATVTETDTLNIAEGSRQAADRTSFRSNAIQEIYNNALREINIAAKEIQQNVFVDLDKLWFDLEGRMDPEIIETHLSEGIMTATAALSSYAADSTTALSSKLMDPFYSESECSNSQPQAQEQHRDSASGDLSSANSTQSDTTLQSDEQSFDAPSGDTTSSTTMSMDNSDTLEEGLTEADIDTEGWNEFFTFRLHVSFQGIRDNTLHFLITGKPDRLLPTIRKPHFDPSAIQMDHDREIHTDIKSKNLPDPRELSDLDMSDVEDNILDSIQDQDMDTISINSGVSTDENATSNEDLMPAITTWHELLETVTHDRSRTLLPLQEFRTLEHLDDSTGDWAVFVCRQFLRLYCRATGRTALSSELETEIEDGGCRNN